MIAAPVRLRAATRSRGNWTLFLLGWGALAVAALAVAWIVVTGLLARSHLNQVRDELPRLRTALASGDMSRARALAHDIDTNAQQAHELSTGPAWWVSANIPVLGTPVQTSRTIAEQADRVGRDVLPGVLALADDLTNMPHLNDSTIDLAKVASAAPMLDTAAKAAHSAAQTVRSGPAVVAGLRLLGPALGRVGVAGPRR